MTAAGLDMRSADVTGSALEAAPAPLSTKDIQHKTLVCEVGNEPLTRPIMLDNLVPLSQAWGQRRPLPARVDLVCKEAIEMPYAVLPNLAVVCPL